MKLTLTLKTLRDRWRSAAAWAAAMTALVSIQLYIYPSVSKSAGAMDQFIQAFPKEMIAMFRIDDYTSAAGFLGTELFSMMIPLVFISVGSSWAAAIAEEEERGTSEVIYALPIRRTEVLTSKVLASWGIQFVFALWLLGILLVGCGAVGLDLEGINLPAAIASCLGLGIFFNALSLAAAAVTGIRGVALGLAIGLALLSFLVFSLAPMVDSFDAVLPFVPFEWALGNNPLKDGFDWVGLSYLALGSAVCYAFAILAINRRDINA